MTENDKGCPNCGSDDLQDTPFGPRCLTCRTYVDEYEAEEHEQEILDEANKR